MSGTLSAEALSLAIDPTLSHLGSRYMLDPATAALGTEAGYPDGFAFYVAGRGGVLGDVEADVVYAAFGFFSAGVVAKMWPRGIAVEGARAAGRRYAAACDAWGRAHLASAPGLARFAELAEPVVHGVDALGLSLFAGLRREPLADDAPARAYRLVTWLRELRGSVHVASVATAGLGGLEAILLDPTGGDFIAKLHGYREPWPDVAHLGDRFAHAARHTQHVMTNIYDRLVPEGARGELADLVAGIAAATT
jgi:hypothetical protein